MSDAQPIDGSEDTAVGEPLGQRPTLDSEALASQAAKENARSKLFGSRKSVPTLGRYRVLERLGAGAMGEVFAAEDPELGRTVAIKVLGPRIAGDATNRERLRQEAQSLARLTHEHVATVYEYGEADARPYLAMERIEGVTLRSWLQTPRELDDVLLAFRQAGWGLHAAHEAGLVHRDFKPDNVMVSEGLGEQPWRVRVMDFGLATTRATPRSTEATISQDIAMDATASVSDPDRFAGTPAYMAPEQYRGEVADARCDQWAFCVSLFEALHGERPFQADSVLALSAAILEGARANVASVGVPRWVADVIDRGLSSRADDRHASMAEVARALDPLPRRWRARTVRTVGASAVVGVGCGVALWAQADRAGPSCRDADLPIDAVWSDGVRGQLKAQFAATELTLAEQTWSRLDERLLAYSQSWRASHRDACQATYVRHEQSTDLLDLRNACLDTRLDAAEVLVQRLQPVDAGVVERAAIAAASLPSISACDDRAQLLGEQRTAPDWARARPFERALADVTALRQLGDHDGALEAAAALQTELDPTDLPRLKASLALEVARSRSARGEPDETAAAARRAYRFAIRSGHDQVAALAGGMIALVEGYMRGELARGLQWTDDAEAFVDRLGDDPLAHSSLLNSRAILLDLSGDLDQAEALHRQAIEMRRGHFGPDSTQVASSLSNLSAVLLTKREFEDAADVSRESIAIIERGLGEDHPEQLYGRLSLAAILTAAGKLDEAEAESRDTLALLRKTDRLDSQWNAMALGNLADVLMRKEQYAEAAEAFERSFEARAALGHEKFADYPNMRASYAVALAEDGRTDEALEVVAEALELESTREGDTSQMRPVIETYYATLA